MPGIYNGNPNLYLTFCRRPKRVQPYGYTSPFQQISQAVSWAQYAFGRRMTGGQLCGIMQRSFRSRCYCGYIRAATA